MSTIRFSLTKQNRESTKGYLRRKVELRHCKFEESGINNWSTKQVPKRGKEPYDRKGKRSLLASHTRCKCSMETTHNSVKVKLGIKSMVLVESLIGWEVTVGQGSECHLTFVRGLSNQMADVTPDERLEQNSNSFIIDFYDISFAFVSLCISLTYKPDQQSMSTVCPTAAMTL